MTVAEGGKSAEALALGRLVAGGGVRVRTVGTLPQPLRLHRLPFHTLRPNAHATDRSSTRLT
jgi:hypothetical protein